MHYQDFIGSGYGMMGSLGHAPYAFGLWFILLLVWSLVWKGLALWRAAQRGETVWFIVFLLVNTAGILEIIYLFFIAKDAKLRGMLGMKTE